MLSTTEIFRTDIAMDAMFSFNTNATFYSFDAFASYEHHTDRLVIASTSLLVITKIIKR